MSTYESDGWQAEETIALITIIKSHKKDVNATGNTRKIDWQHVANEFVHSKGAQNRSSRSISQLRERYAKLKNDYYTAQYRNRSCEYYNYLKDLLHNEQLHEHEEEEADAEELEEPELEEDYGEDVEEKYAHTLQMDYNGDHGGRTYAGPAIHRKWAEGELEAFLEIISAHNLQASLLRKRNGKAFYLLSREMAKRNFSQLPDQLRLKYHQLRRQYAKARKNGESLAHLDELQALFNDKHRGGEEEVDSANSLDSGEEEFDAPMSTESESESALVASMPCNARCKWAEGEVDVFLELITSMGLQSALLRKRNAKIFKLLSKEMAKRSFDKPPEKLRIKFQQLRRLYNKAKRGGESFEHYEVIHGLLNHTEKEPAVGSEANAEGNLSSCSETDFIDSDGEGDTEGGRGKRSHPVSYYWTDHEVDAFLQIIKQQNLFRALDGSKKRNFKTLVYISNCLAKQSYKRTPHQLRNKLRLLTLRYREVKDGAKNVRMQPRHFEMLDDLMQKKRTTKSVPETNSLPATSSSANAMKSSPNPGMDPMESDSDDSASSASSCDLLRAAAEAGEDTFEMPAEPTPLEVLTSISEGQKQLINLLSTSHEAFLRQQREMQTKFLQEMSNIMRQEREATFRMLRELIQPK